MKKWDLQSRLKINPQEFGIDELLKVLLENRGIKTKKEREEFLNPKIESLTADSLGIDKKGLAKSLKRIIKAIDKKEKIIIFGDYDVDGITGTAILWETLNKMSGNVMPYIPHRTNEGYGLSIKGIENLKKEHPDVSLIITVDNGIVANDAVDFANSLKIDVIITDHHIPGKVKPKAYSIVHTTLVCGAGVAYILSREISQKFSVSKPVSSNVKRQSIRASKTSDLDDHLGLVALATVADVMKLQGFNRTLLMFGLEQIRKTKRPGLLALFKLAAIDQEKIGVYELGHIIGPRINAMGRLSHAMDSLRLLCTKDAGRAQELAQKLNSTNLERQQITFDSFLHAKELVGKKRMKKLLFVSNEIYEPGVIGLIAGKLTEEYYRPAIVLSVGKVYSKASARSITGFNIVEFIRLSSNLLVDAGGHPMAAGFTIETKRIAELQKLIEELSEKHISEDLLVRKLRIDCELSLELINEELFAALLKLSPFGPGNPEPTFLAKNVIIEDMRIVGKEGSHLKLKITHSASSGQANLWFDAILFGYDNNLNLKIGDKADIVYTISQNEWQGNKKLELKIKDIKIS